MENIKNNTVIQTIKVGRKEYSVLKGDFILDNGCCFQLLSGDGRAFKYEKWSRITSLLLPKSVIKTIDFDKLIKEEYDFHGKKLTRYYF